ncbi:MAG: hypothetical protein ACRDZR_02700 [Acidimicrobiales bacterium]
MADDRTEELAARLDALAEDVADLALDRLRAAAADGDDPAPALAEERRLTRARRAVEKAATLLRGTG